MERIYHPWDMWEDFRHNFYGGMPDIQKDVGPEEYANFLRDLPRFESALQHIITNWKYACEHNLTNENMNRIAYLGQASFALVFGVPGKESCSSFNLLSPEEQEAANAMAQKYLDIWIEKHLEGLSVHSQKVSGD